MGFFKWCLVLVGVPLAAWIVYESMKEVPVPELKPGWWGKGPKQPESDTSIKKFTVKVDEKVLTDLKGRLANSIYGEDLENTAFEYGFNTKTMKEIVGYWSKKYDWRKHEKELNSYDHFKTKIEGIDVHFIHVKSKSPKAKPLLMIHGWPTSIWEFHKIIPMLTDPVKYGGVEEDAFDLICPSIPGFGWSEAPHQKGFDAAAAGLVFKTLMERLGHDTFYVQGGDFGSFISTIMAQAFPDSIRGVHLSMIIAPLSDLTVMIRQVIGAFFPSLIYTEMEESKLYPFSKVFKNFLEESGYLHIQATKPDTVAMGLLDSPKGLAAYILEKYSTATNLEYRTRSDGGLTEKFTMDELLTNVMIYWTTGTIGSSMRLYKENIARLDQWDMVLVKPPSGFSNFPNEPKPTPESFIARKFVDIVQFTEMPRGGHFHALEEPELFVNDIRNFVRKVESRQKQGNKK